MFQDAQMLTLQFDDSNLTTIILLLKFYCSMSLMTEQSIVFSPKISAQRVPGLNHGKGWQAMANKVSFTKLKFYLVASSGLFKVVKKIPTDGIPLTRFLLLFCCSNIALLLL